jgi:hypothetical protein
MWAPAIYHAPEVSANHLHGDELERARRILSLWGFARGTLVWWLMHEVSLYDGFARLTVQIRGHDSRTLQGVRHAPNHAMNAKAGKPPGGMLRANV